MIKTRYINNLSDESLKFNNVVIRTLAEARKKGPISQKTHKHDFFYMLFLKDGKGKHEIDFVDFPVQPNSLFLMAPGQVHQLYLEDNSIGYMMGFEIGFYPSQNESFQIFQKAKKLNYFNIPLGKLQIVSNLFENIHKEYNLKNAQSLFLIKSYLDILFVQLSRIIEKEGGFAGDFHESEKSEELINLIEKNFKLWKNAAQYAEELNISISSLNSLTKGIYNKTCTQLIQHRILLEAKRLLIVTNLQISEISYELGYEDPSYFIRFFKNKIGVTPKVFRNS